MIPCAVYPPISATRTRKHERHIQGAAGLCAMFDGCAQHSVFKKCAGVDCVRDLKRQLWRQDQIPDLLVPSLRVALNRRVQRFESSPFTRGARGDCDVTVPDPCRVLRIGSPRHVPHLSCHPQEGLSGAEKRRLRFGSFCNVANRGKQRLGVVGLHSPFEGFRSCRVQRESG